MVYAHLFMSKLGYRTVFWNNIHRQKSLSFYFRYFQSGPCAGNFERYYLKPPCRSHEDANWLNILRMNEFGLFRIGWFGPPTRMDFPGEGIEMNRGSFIFNKKEWILTFFDICNVILNRTTLIRELFWEGKWSKLTKELFSDHSFVHVSMLWLWRENMSTFLALGLFQILAISNSRE